MPETLDWNEHLRDNPAFGILEKDEIDELLLPELSLEQAFHDRETILQEGEAGDSLYMIGKGMVRVDAHAPDGSTVTLAKLSEGDIFGELAFFDKKPRSASVTVDDKNGCVVRMIKGEPFHDFLFKHPRLEFKLTLILSDRLRRVTEGAINMQFRSLAEKFELLNTKNEAQLETINNALQTTHALFDSTDNRVKEMSERAEAVVGSVRRNQEWFKYLLMVAGVIGSVLGTLGLKSYLNAEELKGDYQAALGSIKEYQENIRKLSDSLHVQKTFTDDIVEHVAIQQIMFVELSGIDPNNEKYDEKIKEVGESFFVVMNNSSDELFTNILVKIIDDISENNYLRINIIHIIENNITRVSYRRRPILYYILLTALSVEGDKVGYLDVMSRMEEEIRNYQIRYSDPVKDKFSEFISPDVIKDTLRASIYSSAYQKIFIEEVEDSLDEEAQVDDKRMAEVEKMAGPALERLQEDIDDIKEAWNLLPR